MTTDPRVILSLLVVAFTVWVLGAGAYQKWADRRGVGIGADEPMPPPRPTSDHEWRVLAAARGWEHHSEGHDGWAGMSTATTAAWMPEVQVVNFLTGPVPGPDRTLGHFVAFDLRGPASPEVTEAERHMQSRRVCAMRLPVAVPRVVVCREAPVARPFNALTARWNVDVESEDFNRAFEVRTSDRRAATDLLHPRMMEAVVTARPFLLAFEGDWLTWVEMDGPWDPAHLDRTLGRMGSMVALFPTFLASPAPGRPVT